MYFSFVWGLSVIITIRISCSSGGWQDSWEQGVTPWDLGRPTPVILHLHQTGALPKGRALVPGCGSVSFISFLQNITL